MPLYYFTSKWFLAPFFYIIVLIRFRFRFQFHRLQLCVWTGIFFFYFSLSFVCWSFNISTLSFSSRFRFNSGMRFWGIDVFLLPSWWQSGKDVNFQNKNKSNKIHFFVCVRICYLSHLFAFYFVSCGLKYHFDLILSWVVTIDKIIVCINDCHFILPFDFISFHFVCEGKFSFQLNEPIIIFRFCFKTSIHMFIISPMQSNSTFLCRLWDSCLVWFGLGLYELISIDVNSSESFMWKNKIWMVLSFFLSFSPSLFHRSHTNLNRNDPLANYQW